eukprot:477707_1
MPFTVFFFFFDDFFFDPLRDLCLDEGDLCLCFFFGVLITKSIAIPTNYTTNYTTNIITQISQIRIPQIRMTAVKHAIPLILSIILLSSLNYSQSQFNLCRLDGVELLLH